MFSARLGSGNEACLVLSGVIEFRVVSRSKTETVEGTKFRQDEKLLCVSELGWLCLL